MSHAGPYKITATLMNGKKIETRRKTWRGAMSAFNSFVAINIVHREITNAQGVVYPGERLRP